MAVDAKTRGAQVLAELYPDPTVRAAREAELGDAGLTALGNGVLRREDHSREMNELQTLRTAAETAKAEYEQLHGANKQWFEEQQANLQELERLRKQVAGNGGGNPNPNPNPSPAEPKVVTADALAATLAEQERGAVGFISATTKLALQHMQMFNEVLDIDALLADKRVQQIGILGVYREQHKAQLDARDAEIKKKAEDAIRLDERTKVLQQQNSNHVPYPVRGNEPSTLDALEQPPASRPAAATVDQMAEQYLRLQAGRIGAPA